MNTVISGIYTGGGTTYLPTFNKNKDSLAPDVNGTFAGPDKDPKTREDRYKDYVEYIEEAKATDVQLDPLGKIKKDNATGKIVEKTDFAIYDKDENSVDEGDSGIEGVNFERVEETHKAKATKDAQVITMDEWKAMDSPIGDYWVYDADGWAYWANAIMPGEATGLLLDGVTMDLQPDDAWYYGIHVEGQFATAGDWGDALTKTGFYKDGFSDNGQLVLNKAAKRLPTIIGMSVEGGLKQYAKAGETKTLVANIEMKNGTGNSSEQYVVWSCEPATAALRGDKFTPNNLMAGKTYKLTATSSYDPKKTATAEIYVYPSEATGVVKGQLDGKTYVDFGDNTFKEITADGSLGKYICGGEDGIIGNPDDRSDVVVLDLPDPNFGQKFLGPNVGDTYWAMGPDKMLGKAGADGKIDDIKVVSKTTWPDSITNHIADNIKVSSKGDVTGVKIGKKLQMSASVTREGKPIAVQDVIWSVEGGKATTSIDQYGVLTVGADETLGATLTVYAESKEMVGLKSNLKLTVQPLGFEDIPDVAAGSKTTVTIDGVQWYVLVKDGGEALLYAKDPVKTSTTSLDWSTSTIRTDLNGTWLTGKPTLKEKAVEKTIYTRDKSVAAIAPTDVTAKWITTTDKVFLLSEADLFGTQGGSATSEARDYTYGSKPIVPDIEMRKFIANNPATGVNVSYSWLRSAYSSAGVSYVYSTGTHGYISPTSTFGVRPALWVNLTSSASSTSSAQTTPAGTP